MKGGVLGLVKGNSKQIDSFENTKEIAGESFSACAEVLRTHSNVIKGSDLQVGRAAIQKPSTKDSIKINDGSISVSESKITDTIYTDFVYVPGEFAAVNSGSGTFAFDLLTNNIPGCEIERAEINLNQYLKESPDVTPWQVGFYGNFGDAEKGTVYGDNLLHDEEIGAVIESSNKNQLGLTLTDGGKDIKFKMTESGYVEVYQPSNYEEEEFSTFLIENIIPYSE